MMFTVDLHYKMRVYRSFILLLVFGTTSLFTACTSNTEVNSSTVIEVPKELEPLTIKKIDQTPDSAG